MPEHLIALSSTLNLWLKRFARVKETSVGSRREETTLNKLKPLWVCILMVEMNLLYVAVDKSENIRMGCVKDVERKSRLSSSFWVVEVRCRGGRMRDKRRESGCTNAHYRHCGWETAGSFLKEHRAILWHVMEKDEVQRWCWYMFVYE